MALSCVSSSRRRSCEAATHQLVVVVFRVSGRQWLQSVGDGTLRYLDSVKTHLSESETTRTKEHPVEVQAVENREKVKNKK